MILMPSASSELRTGDQANWASESDAPRLQSIILSFSIRYTEQNYIEQITRILSVLTTFIS